MFDKYGIPVIIVNNHRALSYIINNTLYTNLDFKLAYDAIICRLTSPSNVNCPQHHLRPATLSSSPSNAVNISNIVDITIRKSQYVAL